MSGHGLHGPALSFRYHYWPAFVNSATGPFLIVNRTRLTGTKASARRARLSWQQGLIKNRVLLHKDIIVPTTFLTLVSPLSEQVVSDTWFIHVPIQALCDFTPLDSTWHCPHPVKASFQWPCAFAIAEDVKRNRKRQVSEQRRGRDHRKGANENNHWKEA